MKETLTSSQVVFLFGAGASIKAGVPDTYEFVKLFIENLENSEDFESINFIINKLKIWKSKQQAEDINIDIELLLETLTKIKNMKDEPLLEFCGSDDIPKRNYDNLINKLKDFIKSKAIVSEEKIDYLQPLLGFVDDSRRLNTQLNIISLNYDTCIEQLCNVYQLDYQDGFDIYWNPKTFYNENSDINLYKLHGSVIWYRSDRGEYIKLPIMSKTHEIRLINGESADNLMLYPMQKWDYAEPLLELLINIKKILESDSCKFLIVAGYSFRDSHIQRLLWDVSRKNRELHVIIIDPKAYQIYLDKLKYYYNNIESYLSKNRRVICLPYTFEGILKYGLRNDYLQALRAGLIEIEKQYQIEIQGGNTDWRTAIEFLINAEHCEKVEDLLVLMGNFPKKDYNFYLKLLLVLSINYSLNGQSNKALCYFDKFKEELFSMLQGPNVEVTNDIIGNSRAFRINISFHNYYTKKIELADIKKLIETFRDECSRRERISLLPSKEFETIKKTLNILSNYLYYFNSPDYAFNNYLKHRKSQTNFKALQKNYNNYISNPSKDNCEKLAKTIERIEINLFNKINNIG